MDDRVWMLYQILGCATATPPYNNRARTPDTPHDTNHTDVVALTGSPGGSHSRRLPNPRQRMAGAWPRNPSVAWRRSGNCQRCAVAFTGRSPVRLELKNAGGPSRGA